MACTAHSDCRFLCFRNSLTYLQAVEVTGISKFRPPPRFQSQYRRYLSRLWQATDWHKYDSYLLCVESVDKTLIFALLKQWLLQYNKQKLETVLYLFMVALCNRETIYIFMLWFVLSSSSFFFFSLPNLSRRRLDVCHTSTHGVALVRI